MCFLYKAWIIWKNLDEKKSICSWSGSNHCYPVGGSPGRGDLWFYNSLLLHGVQGPTAGALLVGWTGRYCYWLLLRPQLSTGTFPMPGSLVEPRRYALDLAIYPRLTCISVTLNLSFLTSKKWKLLSHVRLFSTPWTPWRSPPASSFHGILQARMLEWIDVPFSSGSSKPMCPALQADSLPSEPPVKRGL